MNSQQEEGSERRSKKGIKFGIGKAQKMELKVKNLSMWTLPFEEQGGNWKRGREKVVEKQKTCQKKQMNRGINFCVVPCKNSQGGRETR